MRQVGTGNLPSIERAFKEYIRDANMMTSDISYKLAASKVAGTIFSLDDVGQFAQGISGSRFSDKANYWTSGLFVSAAINKMATEMSSVVLEFGLLGCPVDCIGYALERGSIIVEGGAGDYLGERMRGGEITVRGRVGNYAGYCMSGGRITVRGDAGCHTGTYMSGGVIEVGGRISSIPESCSGTVIAGGRKIR
ncbi:MAG: hypothetical protein KGI33_02105 [Thaumarchaeota archaeon]|nr:hypothetical protein [Nitrososphaerota archaeon]